MGTSHILKWMLAVAPQESQRFAVTSPCTSRLSSIARDLLLYPHALWIAALQSVITSTFLMKIRLRYVLVRLCICSELLLFKNQTSFHPQLDSGPTAPRRFIPLRSTRAGWQVALKCTPTTKMFIPRTVEHQHLSPAHGNIELVPRTAITDSCPYLRYLDTRIAGKPGCCRFLYWSMNSKCTSGTVSNRKTGDGVTTQTLSGLVRMRLFTHTP